MEGLQSVLKQRDGEVQQLQWEIHRLQTERNFLSNEMSQLTAELEKVMETSVVMEAESLFIKIIIISGFRTDSAEHGRPKQAGGGANAI